ncbi:MAG: (d)CMP kinase [Saprospiraceae bacterium]
MDDKNINIAIDGFSSCGKSTLAQGLAKELGFNYVDSGAMYRAVTLYALRSGLNDSNYAEIVNHLSDIHIECKWTATGNKIYLHDEDISASIRKPEVQNLVSQISTLSDVRRFLVKQQRKMANPGGVVMDGRDIGTKVLPDAELKIFMTASHEVRVQRRLKELIEKGIQISEAEISENLKMRDYIDSTRKDSPLTMALDAHILDNSYLNHDEQLAVAKTWALAKIKIR